MSTRMKIFAAMGQAPYVTPFTVAHAAGAGHHAAKVQRVRRGVYCLPVQASRVMPTELEKDALAPPSAQRTYREQKAR